MNVDRRQLTCQPLKKLVEAVSRYLLGQVGQRSTRMVQTTNGQQGGRVNLQMPPDDYFHGCPFAAQPGLDLNEDRVEDRVLRGRVLYDMNTVIRMKKTFPAGLSGAIRVNAMKCSIGYYNISCAIPCGECTRTIPMSTVVNSMRGCVSIICPTEQRLSFLDGSPA